MEKTDKSLSKGKAAVIFAVVFYAVWAVFELVIKGKIDEAVPNAVASEVVKSVIIKNLAWTLPAVLLVRHYSDELYISLKEMFTSKADWLKSIPVFVLFAALIILPKYQAAGALKISSDFGAVQIVRYLFVGLTEEMVFRGWLVNVALSDEKKKQWPCILLNALLFLLIHIPIWIKRGMLVAVFANGGFITIMVLSIIFSLTFIKNRNILVPITLHMFWDIMVDLIA